MTNVGYKDVQNNPAPTSICHLGHFFLTHIFYQQLLVARLFGLLACVSSEGRVSLSAKTTAHNRTSQQAAVPSPWCANSWQASPVQTVWQQLSGKPGPRHTSLMMAISRSKWGLLQDRRGYWEVKNIHRGITAGDEISFLPFLRSTQSSTQEDLGTFSLNKLAPTYVNSNPGVFISNCTCEAQTPLS